MVKRYYCHLMDIEEDETGGFVEYTYYEQLEKENAKLQEMIKRRNAQIQTQKDSAKRYRTTIQELAEAIKSLMPILQQWEPDYSSAEDRGAWRKAEALAAKHIKSLKGKE